MTWYKNIKMKRRLVENGKERLILFWELLNKILLKDQNLKIVSDCLIEIISTNWSLPYTFLKKLGKNQKLKLTVIPR